MGNAPIQMQTLGRFQTCLMLYMGQVLFY